MQLPLYDPIIQFTVLVAAALTAQLTVRRLHLPGLLGLLVLGMLLGPGGAGVLPHEPVVSLLGQIGLVYVMFIAGIEIDLSVARAHQRQVIVFGLLAFACSALPALAAGLLLGLAPAAAVLLAALVSSHTLLAYPILVRLQLLRRLAVVTAVGGTLLTDTLALSVLAVVLGLHGASGGVLMGLRPIALLAGLAALALAFVPRLARAVFRQDVSASEKALLALATLMVLAAAAELIGTDAILGAFLAGVALNAPLGEREDLREHIEFAGRMLFVPFFFIWTGTLLEFEVLAAGGAVWTYAGALLAVLVTGKFVAAWITGALYGYAAHDRLLIAALTLPQAAATLAVTLTAREAGLFPDALVDAVILVIFVSCLAGPLLTDRAGRSIARATDAGTGRTPLHPPADASEPAAG